MIEKSEQGLFDVLEAELRRAKEPMDCNELFELASVREHAATVNRVSDYLGNLWRKGKVLRLPAPRLEGIKSRWLYVWKDKRPKKGGETAIDGSYRVRLDDRQDHQSPQPRHHRGRQADHDYDARHRDHHPETRTRLTTRPTGQP